MPGSVSPTSVPTFREWELVYYNKQSYAQPEGSSGYHSPSRGSGPGLMLPSFASSGLGREQDSCAVLMLL
jgi:hypothetical protein